MTGDPNSDFFTTGNMASAPTADAPQIVPGVLEGDNDLGLEEEPLDNEPAPKSGKKTAETDWLGSLLGNVTGEEEPGDEEEPADEEEEAAPPATIPGLDPEASAFISSGKGTLDDYYRQKYAPPVQQPDQPTKSPEDEQLEIIRNARSTLEEKLRENYIAAAHAATNGTQAQWNEIMRERAEMETQLSQLSGREAFVNETRQQREAERITESYASSFSGMLVANHGVKPEQAAAVSKKVLEDPYISALVADPKTRGLMAIEMVRDRFVRAALYDMQYSTGKAPRKAPSDPGARPGTGAGPTPTPATKTPKGVPFSDDRSFASFMTTGKPAKAGNK